MVTEIIEKGKPEFEKAVERYREELSKLRTGRSSAALVDNLLVDYYGSKSPLKQMASVTVPEARLIVITPWSRDSLVNIEKAIRESQLDLNPINDGQVIRINISPLNEERRKELVKILNQKTEESRVAVRRIREEILDHIQALEKEGKIGEDDKFYGKDKLQKAVDEYNKRIEEIREKKEDEIMTV